MGQRIRVAKVVAFPFDSVDRVGASAGLSNDEVDLIGLACVVSVHWLGLSRSRGPEGRILVWYALRREVLKPGWLLERNGGRARVLVLLAA